MWPPPSFPNRKIGVLKHVLRFLNAAGLFALTPDRDGRGLIDAYAVIFGAYFIAAAFCLILLIVFTAVDLALRFDDVDILVNRSVLLIGLILTLVKRNSLVGNRRRIEALLVGLQRRRIPENDEASARHVKVFTAVWALANVGFLIPLHLGHPGSLALPSVNASFLGIESARFSYAIVYAWNTVALSLAVLCIFGVDLFVVGTYGEAACRLEALGKTLEDVCPEDFSTDLQEFRPLFDPPAFRRDIRKAVVEHCDVINSIRELNYVFYWTLVFQYTFTAGIIAGCSFYGFISILHGNVANFVQSLIYVIGITCETWFHCKSGDRLKRASSNVAEALWKSRWYALPAKERRSVLLIMTNASGNRLNMSAGRIFRTDLKSLGMIITSAFSYFTVLRNIYKLQIGK